jgi:hypothetical protein
VGWLTRLTGRGSQENPDALARVVPGDEIEAVGTTWKATAVLVYRDTSSQWPVVKIERGAESAWLALEEGQVIRYDHVDLPVSADGQAQWNGRPYRRAEIGTASIASVAGNVDAAVGDHLSYQVLRSDSDPEIWLSVETWDSGFVEVSAGRSWPVDRIVSNAGGRR